VLTQTKTFKRRICTATEAKQWFKQPVGGLLVRLIEFASPTASTVERLRGSEFALASLHIGKID